MDMAQSTHTVSGDFDLTMDELRVVARYVVRHAEDVLSVFEQAVPDDPRPRAAIARCSSSRPVRTLRSRATGRAIRR
jgi:hypothetical protein